MRKYFAYWLDVCNTELEHQIIKDQKELYNRIILIFEGANHFVDSTNSAKEANIWFWLPKFFPPRIKVIVTVSRNSGAMQYFRKLGIETLEIRVDDTVIHNIIEHHRGRKTFLSDALKDRILNILQKKGQKTVIFCKTFISLLAPYPSASIITEQEVRADLIEGIVQQIDFAKVAEFTNLEDLIVYLLEFYQHRLMKEPDRFIKLLLAFAITQKGLTLTEV